MAKTGKQTEEKEWESYEDVSRYLIDQCAEEFGLDRVEVKQTVVGLRSGTEWEIDGRGVKEGNNGFVIIECRCWNNAKQKQEHVGAIAYRIIDTGAKGAIIVSPLGIQAGAEKIASAENIVEVKLNPDCSRYDYVLDFLGKTMLGKSFSETVTCSESIEVVVEERKPDGSVETSKSTIEEQKE